jgi:hypothetical protein
MDFAADRAAMRTRQPVGRQHLRLGEGFVQIFGNRQRIPHAGALMRQARHQHAGAEQQQFRTVIGVMLHALLLHLQPGQPGQQPAAQLSGRIGLAGKGDGGLGHSAS